jgi:hypothetical protein
MGNNIKDMFSVYESVLFLYRYKHLPIYYDAKKTMTSILQNKDVVFHNNAKFKGLVFDIGLMLESESTNPLFPDALRRHIKYYKSLSQKELYNYARYICETFNVNAPRNQSVPRLPEFFTPPGMKRVVMNHVSEEI